MLIEDTTPIALRVIALIATIPARRRSCERLLDELAKRQTRKPDGVVLVLDGYGNTMPSPMCPLPIIDEYRTTDLTGAGNRWLKLDSVASEDIVVCLDDDVVTTEAPTLIESLVAAVESTGGAAAAGGRTADGKPAHSGQSRGDLMYAAGCGLTVRAKHLVGLREFADEIRAAGGPDALGILGDDDALVSAFLWKTGVKIRHAAAGNIYAAPNTRASSQSAAMLARRKNPQEQKLAIKKITGWPWYAIPGAYAP